MELSASEMEEIRKRVQNRINQYLGNDVDDLCKISTLHREWDRKKQELEKSLLVTDEAPSVVGKITHEINDFCTELLDNCAQISCALEEIEEATSSNNELYTFLKENFDRIDQLQKAHAYLNVIQTIQQFSDRIETNVSGRDINMPKAIDEYRKLCAFCLQKCDTSCNNLKAFMVDTVKYWHSVLRKDIVEAFQTSMKNVHWPLVTSNDLTSVPNTDSLSKFRHSLKRALRISIPTELEPVLVSSSVVVAFPLPTLPMVLLLQPLRKRFLFHFSGNSRTNRIDKPEWYFTQVLTWIRDHEKFILQWIQPTYDEMGIGKSALTEFMGGLVKLSLEKLQADIDEAQYDDITFSHIVDESLAYERELRQSHFYPQSLPGPVRILSQAQLFVKWLNMERKFAREKMDKMMRSETAWSALTGDSEEDSATELARSFLALMTTMTDRFSLLPQPGHRLQFVELVLEIIDDFRVALLQVLHTEYSDPVNSKLPQVLNTVYHVRAAIEQFDSSPSMLLLSHYQAQCHFIPLDTIEHVHEIHHSEEPGAGIFHHSLTLLERLQAQLLRELVDNLMMEVKAKSRPYRKEKWYCMTQDDVDVSVVTLSGCGTFQVLANQLHLVHKKIHRKLFSVFWKMVAENVCSFFLEDIVLDNYFNTYGGKVLEKDVNKFLIPLFQHYSDVPSTYFIKLKEACKILAMPSVSPSIKRAALTGNGREVMASLDITLAQISRDKVCAILSRRVDVVPSVM